MAREARSENRIESGRLERIPLGKLSKRLSVLGIPPNMVARWINDAEGRIERAKKGGWQHTSNVDGALKVGDGLGSGEDGPGSVVRHVVGTHGDGKEKFAYLMVIPRELYEQDQQEKQDELDRIDRSIREGRNAPEHADGRYKKEIDYRTNRGPGRPPKKQYDP